MQGTRNARLVLAFLMPFIGFSRVSFIVKLYLLILNFALEVQFKQSYLLLWQTVVLKPVSYNPDTEARAMLFIIGFFL